MQFLKYPSGYGSTYVQDSDENKFVTCVIIDNAYVQNRLKSECRCRSAHIDRLRVAALAAMP